MQLSGGGPAGLHLAIFLPGYFFADTSYF